MNLYKGLCHSEGNFFIWGAQLLPTLGFSPKFQANKYVERKLGLLSIEF